MAVNLQKGQKVDLRKTDGGTLRRVMIGLGWDAAKTSTGVFLKRTHNIDCDASVFICQNGRLMSNDDVVYYGNLKHKSGSITHMGDNLTGDGEGDDEEIYVNLESIPKVYDKIIFVVNIYNSHERNQSFGMIKNAFIRIVDAENHTELCRYNLTENYEGMTAMVFGEIYLRNGQWKFNAIGQGTKDASIDELAARFR